MGGSFSSLLPSRLSTAVGHMHSLTPSQEEDSRLCGASLSAKPGLHSRDAWSAPQLNAVDAALRLRIGSFSMRFNFVSMAERVYSIAVIVHSTSAHGAEVHSRSDFSLGSPVVHCVGSSAR